MKALMAELGISPQKSLGQNFLINQRVISKIVEFAKKTEVDRLIEIGPGLGALTRELPKPLTVIELDRKLSEYWRQQEEIEVIEGDALRIDWEELVGSMTSMIVSNLPYQISSSLVIERSIEPVGVSDMVLMFQKEVAQRIQASPNSKEYGLLSVIAQTFWEIDLLVEAGPRDFYPAPKVASRVLSFSRKKSPVNEASAYLKFVKAAFSQRRKIVWKNLSAYCRKGKNLATEMGLSENLRAENLSVEDFLSIFEQVGASGD